MRLLSHLNFNLTLHLSRQGLAFLVHVGTEHVCNTTLQLFRRQEVDWPRG